MTYTTYISLPNRVEVGQTIDVGLRVASMISGATTISYGLGSKSVNDSDHEISKETTNSVTIRDGQTFIFQVTITKEMLDKQKGNRLCGVWASQTTGKGIATNYYGITTKDAIMGEVRVFRSYSCRQGSRGYIATWYLDRYYDGIATDINYCFGDGYARPSCRIMDEYTGEYTRKYKYIRQSLYDKRAVNTEEKEWMDARLIVVSNTWTPMDGDPRDPCDDVVCPEYDCDGVDKYSSECVEGICIKGVLIEENSTDCGYVEPVVEIEILVGRDYTVWGRNVHVIEVTTDKVIFATGEFTTSYYDLEFFKETAILLPDVTDDPCIGVICDNPCIGADRYEVSCIDGECVYGNLIEVNSPLCPGYIPPDPCKDVVCDDTCIGDDLYGMVCDDGVCVRGILVEPDSSICGYTPPEPEPEPGEPEPVEEPFPYIYIMIGLIILTFMMLVKK